MNIVSLSYSTDLEKPLFRERVQALIRAMQPLEQVECPLKHHFAPGLYLREIFMPAGTVVVGRVHKTRHFNVLVQGACYIVHDDGRREELRAPMVFVSDIGIQKILYILEDMIWMTMHCSDETDISKLDELLVEPKALLEKLS